MGEWRLIAADPPAPRTMVLLGVPGHCFGTGFVMNRLEDPQKPENLPFGYQPEALGGFEYYYVTLAVCVVRLATHWMPLPEPPKKEDD